MKVLFVSSGRNGSVSIVVKNQGESLRSAGIDIDYFIMKGNGLYGYLRSLPSLRKKIICGKYDLVHAHYSLSGFLTSLATRLPLVVSLMGSDIYTAKLSKGLIRQFARRRWNATIVKSDRMRELLNIREAIVIPNGVDLCVFKPEDFKTARAKLKIPEISKIALFVSSQRRKEKNLKLAKEAISLLRKNGVQLLHIGNIEHQLLPTFLNAADVLLLTSIYEGSPNIIKEAMACNCPIVTTDVGDVRELIGPTRGCYVTSFNPAEIAGQLRQAISLRSRTEGRQRIISSELDANSIAKRIIDIYNSIIGS